MWRGYDPTHVDAHLRELSQTIERLRLSDAHQRERAERAERRAELMEQQDEHRLIELLGEETARVLDAARQAASDIRHKAEDAASRLISEANEDAHEQRIEGEAEILGQRARMLADIEDLRQEAAGELEKRRAEAAEMAAEMRADAQVACDDLRQQAEQERASAAAEIQELRSAAREDASRMVAEAQTFRERTLRDLARRRRVARQQLERLNAARERLLAAYEVVRRTADEATTELKVALPEAKAAGDTAVRRLQDESEPTVDELEAQVTMAKMVGLLGDVEDHDAVVEPAVAKDFDAAVEPAAAEIRTVDAPTPGGTVPQLDELERGIDSGPTDGAEPVDEPQTEVDADDDPAIGDPAEIGYPKQAFSASHDAVSEMSPDGDGHVSPGADAGELAPADDAAVSAVSGDRSAVDELFARLRAGHESGERTPSQAEAQHAGTSPAPTVTHLDEKTQGTVSGFPVDVGAAGGTSEADEEVSPGGISEADARLLRQRDESLEPLERALARRLKRVLADEQNEVLDLVRRARSATLDELLPEADAHADRFADAAVDELQAAAFWGAAAIGGQPGESSDALADDLGRAMSGPLRERVARSLEVTEGDLDELTDRLRTLYREWKGQRVGETVHHFLAAAYAHGAFDAVPEDGLVRWVVDRSSPVCPDADDNALAGPICKGEPFPTGHGCAPAHPGCRCLTVPGGIEVGIGPGAGARSASVHADR